MEAHFLLLVTEVSFESKGSVTIMLSFEILSTISAWLEFCFCLSDFSS